MTTPAAVQRLDCLLRESDSVASFVQACIRKVKRGMADITTSELVGHYAEWCETNDLTPLSDKAARTALSAAIAEQFQVAVSHDLCRGNFSSIRGYHGLEYVPEGILSRNPSIPDQTTQPPLPGTALREVLKHAANKSQKTPAGAIPDVSDGSTATLARGEYGLCQMDLGF